MNTDNPVEAAAEEEPKAPDQMSRNELLAYVQMLEAQVMFVNASLRKLEADSLVTVAALVHVQGDQAIILPSVLDEIKEYQIARTQREGDGATIFEMRRKPAPEVTPEVTPEVPPAQLEGS